MNTEELQIAAFEIILNSGNARTIVHEAFAEMRSGNYDAAAQKLEDANNELLLAHKAQTDSYRSTLAVPKSKLKLSWYTHKTIS